MTELREMAPGKIGTLRWMESAMEIVGVGTTGWTERIAGRTLWKGWMEKSMEEKTWTLETELRETTPGKIGTIGWMERAIEMTETRLMG